MEKELLTICKSYANDLNQMYDQVQNEELDFAEWLEENVLDIEITSNLRKDYISASLCLGYGGPNVYINTRNGYIEGYWGGDSAQYPLEKEVWDFIDDEMELYWSE